MALKVGERIIFESRSIIIPSGELKILQFSRLRLYYSLSLRFERFEVRLTVGIRTRVKQRFRIRYDENRDIGGEIKRMRKKEREMAKGVACIRIGNKLTGIGRNKYESVCGIRRQSNFQTCEDRII